jgi:hypothetical protein
MCGRGGLIGIALSLVGVSRQETQARSGRQPPRFPCVPAGGDDDSAPASLAKAEDARLSPVDAVCVGTFGR